MTAVKLEDARRVISAAEREAKEIGQPMNIAVADEGGHIVAHVRMDNARRRSVLTPPDKAVDPQEED